MIATRPDVLRQLEMLKVPERTTLREHLASRMQLPKGAEYITDMHNDPGLMKETKLSGALSSCAGDVRRLKYKHDGRLQKLISLDTQGPCMTTNNPWLLSGLSACFEPLHAITGDEAMSMVHIDFYQRSDGMLFEFKWPESEDNAGVVLKRYAAGNAIPGCFARMLFTSAIICERFRHAYVQ